MAVEVHCSRCGSADTEVTSSSGTVKHGHCYRCDKPFEAMPCPHCASYTVDGSYGVSGTRFNALPSTVHCHGCKAEIPVRDPGAEDQPHP